MAVDVSKHLDRAKRYLEKNKVQDAIEAYLAVLEDAPTHQEATQALGDLYARLDKPDRAAVYYGVLFDLLTEPRDEPKALAIYTRFLKTSTQPPERIARYAMLLQKQNRVEDAIEQYTLAAEIFQERGREEEALTCHERAAQLNPDDLTRHLKLAETAERIGKTAIAARAYLRSGQLAAAAGNHSDAAGLFEQAYRIAPQERSVALLYAEAKLRAGDGTAAVKLLEPFAIAETDSTFLETYADALMRSGQLEQALVILERSQSEKSSGYGKFFDLASLYAKAKQDSKAIEILQKVKKRMFKVQRESEFAAQVDRIAEANSSSVLIGEFWGALYNELNRESKYFDVLVRLFDTYLGAGEVRKACDTLEKLVDIDAYDFRNQQRMEQLRGKAPEAALQRIASRLAKSASMAMPPGGGDRGLDETSRIPLANVEGRAQQALEDLLVQTEIFLQYSLQAKAVDRLQKIAEMFPGEEEHNARLYNLYELAHWWPPGSNRKQEVPIVAAQPASVVAKTGAYTAETLRDLSKISEISQTVYRQPTPRAMLNIAVNEVGTHLKVARCLSVIGAPGRPPEMAAEFCAPGVKPAPGAQIVLLLSQIEKAVPDSLGGLALDAAAAPVLKELGLETALGVALTDKETQAPAGMLVVAHTEPHKWKPNETYFLQAVGDQMLLSVSHTRLRSLVRRMGVADERTGLLGRSSYADCLLSETERAKTQGTPLAVTILQIDHGPELLRHQGETLIERHMEQLAKSLQPVVRQNDVAVKYTSWSLAFILPDTTLAGARNLADKLQRAAAAVRPPWEGAVLTVSAGIAEAIARPDFDNEDIVTDLMNRAEASIEEARKKGGDTIVAAEVATG